MQNVNSIQADSSEKFKLQHFAEIITTEYGQVLAYKQDKDENEEFKYQLILVAHHEDAKIEAAYAYQKEASRDYYFTCKLEEKANSLIKSLIKLNLRFDNNARKVEVQS